MTPKYPNITVKLIDEDSNAFAILGRVSKALRNGGVSKAEVDEFCIKAMNCDYNEFLVLCMDWVNIEDPDEEEDEWDSGSEDDEDEEEDWSNESEEE